MTEANKSESAVKDAATTDSHAETPQSTKTKMKANKTEKSSATKDAIDNEDADFESIRGLFCCCIHPNSCSKCGLSKSNQDNSTEQMKIMMKMHCPRPELNDVFGNGPLFLSHIPASAKQGVSVGIDEAGRGSVLGPMVYGCCFWSTSAEENKQIPSGFQDSKALNDQIRSKLLDQLLANEHIGYAFKALSPNEISRAMLRPNPYNLNAMSHDTAMTLIHKLLSAGVNVQTCYIDTVGDENSYRRRLEFEFPTLRFFVEKKADAKYPVCSAASVVAKVVRDRMMEGWKFSELGVNESISREFGSGYPGDAICKKWFDHLHDELFGYSNLVRFSWAPIKDRLTEHGVSVTFKADIDEDEFQQQSGMAAFLATGASGKKRKRLDYFAKRNLGVVTKLTN